MSDYRGNDLADQVDYLSDTHGLSRDEAYQRICAEEQRLERDRGLHQMVLDMYIGAIGKCAKVAGGQASIF